MVEAGVCQALNLHLDDGNLVIIVNENYYKENMFII